MTPYEKLKSLFNAEQYLQEGFSFAELDNLAYNESDTDFARRKEEMRKKLFDKEINF